MERRYNSDESRRKNRADAAFVKEQTGFAIGGIAPIGHTNEPIVLVDGDLMGYKTIWASAGHPKAVFQLTPDELLEMTDGKVVKVNE